MLPIGVLLAAVAGQSRDAFAQISPGPLARAHAALDGPLDCMECHAKGDKGLDRQCLACHKEIAATKEDRRGLHGKGRLDDCARCHPDHAGADFELISWEEGSEDRFDHTKTTFALEGKHRDLECRDCHNAELAVSPIAALSPRSDRSRGFVGLETTCRSCHEDVHRGQFGEDCASCHAPAQWKPAGGFRHEDSDFPLTGEHAALECDACHRAERLGLPVAADGVREALWKPLAHGECSDCHDDPHQARLGPECSSCHVTRGFTETESGDFDHAKTRYPLLGKHRDLECSQCHDEKTAWGPRPRFEHCTDCHEQAHGQASRLAGAGSDCASCHTVDTFRTSTITAARHADFDYALEGAHARVACRSCHPRRTGGAAAGLGSAGVLLKPRHAACRDCHEDPHAGRFAPGGEHPYAEGCPACHGLDAFRPARFGIEDHARTRFPLEAAHLAVPCNDCHAALSPSARRGVGDLAFRERFGLCSDCHESPHGAQFAGRGDCSACHGGEAFAPADAFDHRSLEAFPLTGAHAGVACSACHPTRDLPDGGRQVVYLPIAHECQDCHGPDVPGERGERREN